MPERLTEWQRTVRRFRGDLMAASAAYRGSSTSEAWRVCRNKWTWREARAAALPSAPPAYRSSADNLGLSDEEALRLAERRSLEDASPPSTTTSQQEEITPTERADLDWAIAASLVEEEKVKTRQREWQDIDEHFRQEFPNALSPETTGLLQAVAPLRGRFEVQNVPGDGLCLLHAVNATLNERTPTRITQVRLDELAQYVDRIPALVRAECVADLEAHRGGRPTNDLAAAWIYAICMHTRCTVALMTHATVHVHMYVPTE